MIKKNYIEKLGVIYRWNKINGIGVFYAKFLNKI